MSLYKGNVKYFSRINTNAKAYIAGFIAADGCLTKNKTAKNYTLTITIHRKDLAVLEFIKSEIGCEHKIRAINTKMGFDHSRNVDHVRFCITDSNINNALINIGIKPSKSLTMQNIIPNISKKYRKAFILGYFDGDGSITHNKKINIQFCKRDNVIKHYPSKSVSIQIRGTKEFLLGIPQELEINIFQIREDKNICSLIISKRIEILKFFSCYDKMPFYLERKYLKFKERI